MSYAPHDVEWTPEKVARVWDFYGSVDAFRPLYFSAHSGAAIVGRADREVDLRGKRVLDFGAGHGDLLAHLFARGIAAKGLEFSSGSALATRTRFRDEPLFGGIEIADELPAPFPEGSFDVIFLVEVVEHLLDEQIDPTLAEVRRLLAAGGAVVVTAPNAEDLRAEAVRCPDCGGVFHQFQHQRSLDPRSMAQLFESRGFRTQKSEGVYWGLTPYAVVRTWLRNPGRLPRPHLLYVGRR